MISRASPSPHRGPTLRDRHSRNSPRTPMEVRMQTRLARSWTCPAVRPELAASARQRRPARSPSTIGCWPRSTRWRAGSTSPRPGRDEPAGARVARASPEPPGTSAATADGLRSRRQSDRGSTVAVLGGQGGAHPDPRACASASRSKGASTSPPAAR